jgi:hypothetical protein
MIIEFLALLGLILCFAGYRLLKVFKLSNKLLSSFFVHSVTAFFLPRLSCFFVDLPLAFLSCTLSLR